MNILTSNDLAPAPMEGGGNYNRSSGVQASDLDRALARWVQAARNVPLAPSPEPILLADYGSSQGRNSLAPMKAAIGVLRARLAPGRPICVTHTDLPGNDFAALFQTLEGDAGSYLASDPAVYASAVGRSFYQPILPPASVSLGWSSWAVQWLSRAPAPVPDHVQVAYSSDLAIRQAFVRQAAQDWRDFLAARSAELRPGGRLVLLTMACDEAGDFGYRSLLQALVDEIRGMVDAGEVRPAEWARMSIPTVGRSRDDWLEPFAASGSFEGLVLAHFELFDGHDPFWDRLQSGGDARAFGANWAAFSRASVFPTLAAALEEEPDVTARRLRFIDRLEAGVAKRMAAAPERLQVPLALLEIAKPA